MEPTEADLFFIDAKPQEQGAFCDTLSGHEYQNLSQQEATEVIETSMRAGYTIDYFGRDPTEAETGDRFNAHYVAGDHQGIGYSVGIPRTPGL